jgi:Uma2 family endonuclease
MAMIATQARRPEAEPVPPLENGDHLKCPEFERRYDATPHLNKAELVEGVVYLRSSVGHEGHGKPHFHLIGWLDRYVGATQGIDGGDGSSIRLDMDNMPQPDAFLYILPAAGGRVRIDEDDYVVGAPELAAEVASSSVSYDLHAKLNAYRRNGVREYVVWRTRDRAIDWLVLREGQFVRLEPDAAGLLKSEAFPGLWLDPAALIRDDRAALVRAVQQGVASPEHAAFVARRQAAGGGPAQA